MALDDLQPSKAREFGAKLMTPGRENGRLTMVQPLLMETAVETVVDGPIQTRSGWVAEEEVSNPTNNE